MRKNAGLTAFFVLAAVILAVWFAGERDVTSEQSMLSVADVQPPSPPIAEETVSATVVERTDAPVDAAPLPTLSSTEPVRLFSRPDYGSVEYLNAMNNATAYASRYPVQPIRSTRLLTRNEVAINELIRQLESNSDGLTVAFEISPAEILACTISSIRRRNPDFTPGGVVIPARYRVETKCDESGDDVTVGVDRSTVGTIGIGIASWRGGLSINSIDDSDYVVVLEHYP